MRNLTNILMMKLSVMKKIMNLMILTVIVVSIQSCYYDNPPEPIPFDCADVSYSTHLQPIWDKACATSGCHDGNREPNLLPDVSWNNLVSGGYVNLEYSRGERGRGRVGVGCSGFPARRLSCYKRRYAPG
jgi:hypothetical protein